MMHPQISQVSLSSTASVISAEKSAQEKTERNEKYAGLSARKEALDKQLRLKNNELKRLCVQEAELTGSLPLETPLEPGELPPTFRRRMGTAFTIPQNFFDNLKSSNEEQTLAALELEYKILSQITSAALRMANDVSLKRAVRRQRRIEYQQNSKRLTELELRLNEARKNHKHRKKPRPASDLVGGGEASGDKEPSEGGFGGQTNLTRAGRSSSLALAAALAQERPPTSSSSSSSLSQHTHLLPPHHHTHESTLLKQQDKLHATLSAPHQYLQAASPDFRAHRHQLQRLGSGGYFTHHHPQHQSHRSSPTNNYTTLSGAPLEMERFNTAFIMSPSWGPFAPHDVTYLHHHSHTARPAASQNFLEMDDNEPLGASPSRHPSLESRSSRWKGNRFGSLDRKKKMAQSSPCLDSRSVEGLDIMQPDLDVPDRGAFAGPKCPAPSGPSASKPRAETKAPPPVPQHRLKSGGTPPVAREPSWQMTPGPSGPPAARAKDPPPPPPTEALLPGQTYPEHSYGQPALDKVRLAAGQLVRTQSLGSVGTASSGKSAPPPDTRSIKDMYPSTSYTHQQQPPLPPASPKRHPPPLPPDKPRSRRPSGHSGHSGHVGHPELIGSLTALHVSVSDRSDRSLNSPQGSVGGGPPEGGAFESPKNHMVIQAGKWQPYWEESKPFEMSDFYKYSTKYRNKATPPPPAGAGAPPKQQPLHLALDDEAAHVCLPKRLPSPTPSMSPQQKGVYQPLQPMTCQPLQPPDPSTPDLPAKQGKVMSPNMSLNLANGESLADAFSSEMLAWYQDKSLPRSATLV